MKRFSLLSLILASACSDRPGNVYAPGDFPGDERINIPVEEDKAPPPKRGPKRNDMTAEQYAKSFETPRLCETEAKKKVMRDQEYGWTMLKTCVDREDFVDLHKLARPPWQAFMKKRKQEGLSLIARVISNRGGNIELDLVDVNDQGIQVFRLGDAMDNPKVFRGRYVLMRGHIADEEVRGRSKRYVIIETSLRATNVKSWGRRYSHYRKGGRWGAVDTRGRTTVASTNVAKETGREVMGWIEKKGGKIQKNTDYIFLVRFADVARARSDDPEGTARGMAAIIDYYEPPPD